MCVGVFYFGSNEEYLELGHLPKCGLLSTFYGQGMVPCFVLSNGLFWIQFCSVHVHACVCGCMGASLGVCIPECVLMC